MFHAAFLADQPNMKRSETDTILYDKLGGLDDAFIEKLGQLYAEPFNTLIASGDSSGNPRKMTVEL